MNDHKQIKSTSERRSIDQQIKNTSTQNKIGKSIYWWTKQTNIKINRKVGLLINRSQNHQLEIRKSLYWSTGHKRINMTSQSQTVDQQITKMISMKSESRSIDRKPQKHQHEIGISTYWSTYHKNITMDSESGSIDQQNTNWSTRNWKGDLVFNRSQTNQN